MQPFVVCFEMRSFVRFCIGFNCGVAHVCAAFCCCSHSVHQMCGTCSFILGSLNYVGGFPSIHFQHVCIVLHLLLHLCGFVWFCFLCVCSLPIQLLDPNNVSFYSSELFSVTCFYNGALIPSIVRESGFRNEAQSQMHNHLSVIWNDIHWCSSIHHLKSKFLQMHVAHPQLYMVGVDVQMRNG